MGKLSKFEEIDIRRRLGEYKKFKEAEQILEAMGNIKKLKKSLNERDRDLTSKVEGLTEDEVNQFRLQCSKDLTPGQGLFESLLEGNSELVEATVWIGGLDRASQHYWHQLLR